MARHQDAIRMGSLDLLKQYAKECEALTCASETLSFKSGFRALAVSRVARSDSSHGRQQKGPSMRVTKY